MNLPAGAGSQFDSLSAPPAPLVSLEMTNVFPCFCPSPH
jgi:hypothetical protein